MLRTTLAAAAVIAAGAAANAERANFTPGEWTYTVSFNAAGQTMSDSNTDCMNAAEASMDTQSLVEEFSGGAECTSNVVNQVPGSITFDMTCPATESMQSARLTMTYQSKSFTITGPVTLNLGNGKTLEATLDTRARYLGACPS